jgi:stringent starvation protein B
MMEMSSTRPYLVRAIYDWILENRCTPYLLADAGFAGVRVPRQAIKEGQVLLNIAPHAIDRLELGIDEVRFNARFSGVSQSIVVPAAAILAIYAQENGQGMMFPAESPAENPDESAIQGEPGDTEAAPRPMLAVPAVDAAETADDTVPPPERARPSLRIVK